MALLLALATAAPAIAASQGSGRWFWPSGTEDFGGMSGWWQCRGDCWHLAQDMAVRCGKPVYAIGAGTVLESKYVSRYGPGGSRGGAVVILHKTATGREFKALYGHLSNLRYTKGQRVAAGAVIGTVNASSPNHLHFGVHPGRAYPSDNNPFRGHTYSSSNTYGFVNPVSFLRNNPRVIPYVAPSLPTVASIATTCTPLSPGAAKGYVYWLQASADATSTWRYSIASAVMTTLTAEETVPPYDTRRYRVFVYDSPPRLKVVDRRPTLRARAAHTTPAYGKPAVLRGSVRNAAGKPFAGARVTLQRWSGRSWVAIDRTISDAGGAVRFAYTPKSRSHLRTRFLPPDTYIASAGTTVTVAPHVSLTKPSLAESTVRRGSGFRATSYLKPRHSTSATVRFQFERYAGGRWVRVASISARLRDYSNGRTACTVYSRCTRSGSWRVRAFMPADRAHASTWTGWRSFTVR